MPTATEHATLAPAPSLSEAAQQPEDGAADATQPSTRHERRAPHAHVHRGVPVNAPGAGRHGRQDLGYKAHRHGHVGTLLRGREAKCVAGDVRTGQHT